MTEWGFTLENVTASWGKGQNIIENLNFTCSISNSTTALLPLMGPSGQGKSTLLYLSLRDISFQRLVWNRSATDGTDANGPQFHRGDGH